MKIVVIGGTGLIGSKTVVILRQGGHEVVAASRGGGVNTVTGEGLKEAIAGAQVVIARLTGCGETASDVLVALQEGPLLQLRCSTFDGKRALLSCADVWNHNQRQSSERRLYVHMVCLLPERVGCGSVPTHAAMKLRHGWGTHNCGGAGYEKSWGGPPTRACSSYRPPVCPHTAS
jgi:hypothetical protein